MLQNRLKKFPILGSLDIRDRHSKLLELEGWYETDTTLPNEYKQYYTNYVASGSRLKFTRWLARQNVDANLLSQLGKYLTTTSFKFSCRHNDLIRLGDTPHYKSCMSNIKGGQQLHYLADPDVAVVFVPDAAGKFIWRCLVRLTKTAKGYVLIAYRVYGNGPTSSILATLSRIAKLPVHPARDIKRGSGGGVFYSATKINNVCLTRPIWTDHYLSYSKQGRIGIRA